ncbi:uncharacterized protein STEHIDRAFT_145901 [Stereum hirsutum FP-91666 SS1]|uniref:uncharacterized protein n=1 Tax=Stereum hirsutum (strain FP-91666) TaxID=721885 RepID=UPI000440B2BD|nr:uncharacterized protein STEHIDRAFT_145901 [Stereum hirsutum FP-91666 SS1]EIM89208.1 hypothetical protein STEHIDRAFT_145901 [Stereum hirsutum FP-91666 SS1]
MSANNTNNAAPAQGDVVINMASLNGDGKKEKKTDTLFGPNIGIVSAGPDWAASEETLRGVGTGNAGKDELTPDIVKEWVERSKESVQPTTTLQALVNLKRPTLKLSPLTHDETEDPSAEHHELHALEFEYDCDAPKCAISVSIVHPLGTNPSAVPSDSHRTVVYEAVFDGGFGKTLKHEDGASLELSLFEHGKPKPRRPSISFADGKANDSKDNLDLAPPATIPELQAPGSNSSSGTATPNPPANGNTIADGAQHRERKKRFTALSHFRKRNNHSHNHNTSISGPALAVMDAEAGTASGDHDQTQAGAAGNAGADVAGKDAKDAKEDEGVKVVIRLAACDEDGKEFEGGERNEQGTYLHVVRFGPEPPVVESSKESEEDGRPWVVKVVKREATIGPHTFHLHEIYGLTSSSSSAPAPSAPPAPNSPTIAPTSPKSPTTHTYPPPPAPPGSVPGAIPGVAPPAEDEPSSECLLCLSSPREVVLLPCRHLVACKECAVNMVEFGAGGNIVHSEEPTAGGDGAVGEGAGEGAAGASGGADGTAAPTAPSAVPERPATRRKRRAKGWFCPVCRQPYTSLLRITTTPPAHVKRTSTSLDTDRDHQHQHGGDPLGAAPAPPVTTVNSGEGTGETATGGGGGGLLAGLGRPGFLRGLSRGRPDAQTGANAV